MADINIKKGHNIKIAGAPIDEINNVTSPKFVAVQPIDFRSIKPKLLVKEGDSVKVGSPLFFNKINPDVKWPSLGGGIVKSIEYGDRRSIQKIVVELAESENYESFDSYKSDEILNLEPDKILSSLIKGSMFPFIRQRPFNKVADPKDIPRDIFVSGWNTSPLSVNLDLALRGKSSQFQAGINALNKLTSGNVHLSFNENTVSDTLIDANNVKSHTLSGPHPAGNVGIQIHKISRLKPNEIIWTVNAQDVVRIGTFFLTGKLDVSLIAAVAGPALNNPAHIKSRLGSNVETMLENKIDGSDNRIISGDVLIGRAIKKDGFLGFYDSVVTALPEGGEREFLGMLRPGTSDSRYSLTNAFLGSKLLSYSFNTLLNGSERYMVPINSWENVLPMDVIPNSLYRAILVEDIEEMEQLGILECDDEDFALCSFACPSKIDVGAVIRKGLDLMEKEL